MLSLCKINICKRGKLTPAYLGFTTEKNNSKILNAHFVAHGYLYQYCPLLKEENNGIIGPFHGFWDRQRVGTRIVIYLCLAEVVRLEITWGNKPIVNWVEWWWTRQTPLLYVFVDLKVLILVVLTIEMNNIYT